MATEERAKILLRAAYDLLTRASRSHYVLEACSILTQYDGTDCDGECLRNDIAFELEIDEDSDPLPLIGD